MREVGTVFWWGLLAFAALILLIRLCYWAFTDPDIDRDIAKDRFQAEQEWRALRRAGKL